MQFPEHPFWDFALKVYGAEGVAAACLNLQERHGIDVNLMLFCLWIGHSGRGVISEPEMLAALATSDRWHRTVVKGLRFVRRALKDRFPDAPADLREALRGQVQRTEIDSEHLEQFLLSAAVPRDPLRAEAPLEERAHAAAANVARYLAVIDVALEPRDAVDFAHILGKTFGGLTPDLARDLAEGMA